MYWENSVSHRGADAAAAKWSNFFFQKEDTIRSTGSKDKRVDLTPIVTTAAHNGEYSLGRSFYL